MYRRRRASPEEIVFWFLFMAASAMLKSAPKSPIVAIFGIGLMVIAVYLLFSMGGSNQRDWDRSYYSFDNFAEGRRQRTAYDYLRRAVVTRAGLKVAEKGDRNWQEDRIRIGAYKFFIAIQQAWSALDARSLKQMLTPACYQEFEKRLQALTFNGRRSSISNIKVASVTVVDLHDSVIDEADRFTVRIEFSMTESIYTLRDKQELSKMDLADVEYWIFARNGGYWRLAHIRNKAEYENAPDNLKAV